MNEKKSDRSTTTEVIVKRGEAISTIGNGYHTKEFWEWLQNRLQSEEDGVYLFNLSREMYKSEQLKKILDLDDAAEMMRSIFPFDPPEVIADFIDNCEGNDDDDDAQDYRRAVSFEFVRLIENNIVIINWDFIHVGKMRHKDICKLVNLAYRVIASHEDISDPGTYKIFVGLDGKDETAISVITLSEEHYHVKGDRGVIGLNDFMVDDFNLFDAVSEAEGIFKKYYRTGDKKSEVVRDGWKGRRQLSQEVFERFWNNFPDFN